MSGPIRSVAVLGDGIVGWSAAAAFARAMPQLEVTVIACDSGPAALADLLPGSTSSIHRFHAAIGLSEAALLRPGAAVPRLAFRFERWGRGADRWFHVHGEHGRRAGSIAFHHYWARARREGRALPWHRYAIAGVMAEAGKFAYPERRPDSPFGDYDYGLRIEPGAYRRLLADHAAALRVRTAAARFAAAERRGDGGIAALLLAGGGRVEADLFVDASGPSAALLGPVDAEFEDWSIHYPCRWLTQRDAAPLPPSPADSVVAEPEGWTWRTPLSGRTMSTTLRREPSPGAVELRPGRRPRPWIGNVLAIGDAALALDPLHALPLHAAHHAVLRALELLPGRDCNRLETGEYNRRALLESERLRDFQLLHHLAAGSPAAPNPGLAHMLGQFEKRGRLVQQDEDSIAPEIWIAALLGLGLLPEAIDPLADTIPSDAAARAIAELAEHLERLVERLPQSG